MARGVKQHGELLLGVDGGGMSRFAIELREAPEAVARQEPALSKPLRELVARLADHPPALVVTCARGSSAHAATFAKHLIERHLAIPVAAAAPVIATVYRRDLRLEGPAVSCSLAVRL